MAFVLEGWVQTELYPGAPHLDHKWETYVFGVGDNMRWVMYDRYNGPTPLLTGVEKNEKELRLKFRGQCVGYGDIIYSASDEVFKKDGNE
ncbi:MAG: hypothetical protein QXX68_02350 [Candidatus Pacearchaeota archaeon]